MSDIEVNSEILKCDMAREKRIHKSTMLQGIKPHKLTMFGHKRKGSGDLLVDNAVFMWRVV